MANRLQFDRWNEIDRILRDENPGKKTKKAIAEKLGVSAKTIQRDVDAMKKDWNAPIIFDKNRKQFRYTDNSYIRPRITIREKDFFAVCIASKVLEQYKNTPVHNKLKNIFKKIQNSLPENVSIDPGWLDSSISVMSTPQRLLNPDIWERVASGLCDGKTLRFSHTKPEAETSAKRDVDPYHIISYDGDWYLVGYCRKTESFRTFSISRIREAKVLPYHFRKKPFNIKEYFGPNRFGIIKGEKEWNIRIKFRKQTAPYILDRIWQDSQQIEKKENGEIILSFTANNFIEIKKWILSYGKNALVIEPRELADQIKEELTEALNHYL